MLSLGNDTIPLVIIEPVVSAPSIGEALPATANHSAARLAAESLFEPSVVQYIGERSARWCRPDGDGYRAGNDGKNHNEAHTTAQSRTDAAQPLRPPAWPHAPELRACLM